MPLVENVASLTVFEFPVAGFALGYLLREWVDEGREERADTIAYRQRQARKREDTFSSDTPGE